MSRRCRSMTSRGSPAKNRDSPLNSVVAPRCLDLARDTMTRSSGSSWASRVGSCRVCSCWSWPAPRGLQPGSARRAASASTGGKRGVAPPWAAINGSFSTFYKKSVAEGLGFEPRRRSRAQRFSRPPPSTTRPSLRAAVAAPSYYPAPAPGAAGSGVRTESVGRASIVGFGGSGS